MKTWIWIILIWGVICLIATPAPADSTDVEVSQHQAFGDSTQTYETRSLIDSTKSVDPFPGGSDSSARFIDEDGDGLPDPIQNRYRKGRQKMDRFIDRDGDGICDHRSLTDKLRRLGHGPGQSGNSSNNGGNGHHGGGGN